MSFIKPWYKQIPIDEQGIEVCSGRINYFAREHGCSQQDDVIGSGSSESTCPCAAAPLILIYALYFYLGLYDRQADS